MEAFLEKLEKPARAKLMQVIYKYLSDLEPNDIRKYPNQIRTLEDGLYDVRTKETVYLRAFFKIYSGHGEILLIDGLVKKTDKIDPTEIESALKKAHDWESRRKARNKNG